MVSLGLSKLITWSIGSLVNGDIKALKKVNVLMETYLEDRFGITQKNER